MIAKKILRAFIRSNRQKRQRHVNLIVLGQGSNMDKALKAITISV